MKGTITYPHWEIEIDDQLLNKITRLGEAHFPNEYGGFLIGYYASDGKKVHITDTILPKKFEASPNLFVRYGEGLEKIFLDYYNQQPQKYYVGEWHTHPNGLPIPSTIDVNGLQSIKNSDQVAILNPVLLIIGYMPAKVSYGAYVLIHDKVVKYEF